MGKTEIGQQPYNSSKNREGARQERPAVFDISVKSFLSAIIMLILLMVLTYGLTFLIPSGSFERITADGGEQIVPGTFTLTEGGIPFWKWLLSPILVLGAEGGGTIVAIIVFLFVVGGIFHCLDKSGLMVYMLDAIGHRYREKKYQLLWLVCLFFMCMGSFVGSFEESVPLVPLAVALAVSLGWDALVGLGMSLLAIGCGFATGICNPFTVGVAQQLAGLPMFSGSFYRILSFAVIYLALGLFLTSYAKKIEKNPEKSLLYGKKGADVRGWQETEEKSFVKDEAKEKGLKRFVLILGCGILLIFSSGFFTFLQPFLMPMIAVLFLAAGLAAVKACRMDGVQTAKYMKDGAVSLLPAVLLILMASSIRYTLEEAKILDTILYQITQWMEGMPKGEAILFLYLTVLVMNFFISSGSAKAFLLIPLLMPVADLCGIDRQSGILAFAFGDGFSNVFYFTNPVLLISLGLAGVGYGVWARWSVKFQFLILALSSGILLLSVL